MGGGFWGQHGFQGKRSIKREYRKLNGTYLPIKGGGEGRGFVGILQNLGGGGDQINCIVTTDDDE